MTQHHLTQQTLEAEKQELEDFIQEHRKTLRGRKLIEEFLLFISCQVLSSSLAILLFQFTFKLWVLSLICYGIGLVPSLPDLSEISVNRNEEGNLEVNIMRKPGLTLVKLIVGTGLTYVGIQEVRGAVTITYEGIDRVYSEIHEYERPQTSMHQIPVEPMALFGALGLVGFYLFVRGKLPS